MQKKVQIAPHFLQKPLKISLRYALKSFFWCNVNNIKCKV